MRILHVFPASQPQLAHYVSMLTTALAAADIETQSTDDLKAVPDLCQQWQPDILHQHGSLNLPQLSTPRLVITAHGHTVRNHRAYVIIARSPMEQQRLSETFPRIEIIRNPIITRTITPRQTAEKLLKVYQKVMDSNVLELMDDTTRRVLPLLLKVGIAGDSRWATEREELRLLSENTTPPHWRQLFIYAYQEGVLSTLQHGIDLLRLAIPSQSPETVSTYLPQHYRHPQPVGCNNVLTLTEHIYKEVAQGELSLCRIVELHKLLMETAVDDDRLREELEAHKLSVFFRRLLQIASELTLLDEGYMPDIPLNDRTTQSLRKLINKHLSL